MRYIVRILLVIFGVSVITIILHSIGIQSHARPNPTTSPRSVSEQDLYRSTLIKDDQSLDRGVLLYSRFGNLNTGASTQFSVVVLDIGKGFQQDRVTQYNGMSVYPQDVPMGGIVGVRIIACENLTCQSESSPEQPVLLLGQHANWYWQITAGIPGPAEITLRVDTYDQGSQLVLSEEIVHINAEVIATAAFKHQQSSKKIANATKSVVGDIEAIGAVAAAILAVGGIVGWIVVKSRKPGSTNQTPGARSRKPASTNRTSRTRKQR